MSVKYKPFEKVLTLLATGGTITLKELDKKLGHEIYVYRVSTYVWHIKKFTGCAVKPIKEGKKVVAYKLANDQSVQKAKEFLAQKPAFVPSENGDKKVRGEKRTGTTSAPKVDNRELLLEVVQQGA